MTTTSTHPEDIKATLRKRYGTVLAFEVACAVPQGSVRDVLRGRAVARTAQAIADELKVDVHELFPGRFLSLKRDDSSDIADAHRLNAAVQ